MPTFLHVLGSAYLLFAVALLAKPRVRPSPAAYTWAITVDVLGILAALTALTISRAWWLPIPLTLWAVTLGVHIHRLHDACSMVRTLADHEPHCRSRRCHPRSCGDCDNAPEYWGRGGWGPDDQRPGY